MSHRHHAHGHKAEVEHDPLEPELAAEPNATWDVMLKRGLRKRCPRCGGGHLYTSWVRMRERCPTCGFKFEREPGFFVGAYFVNFAVTEGLLFLAVIAVVVMKNNDPDSSLVIPLVVAGVLAIVAPILLYPFARTTWSAIDLAMTPLELDEIVSARDHLQERGEADDA
jgi:uncharacterized protein (DUF983 family)